MIESIICGILAGFIACRLNKKEGKGCLVDLLLGIVGAAFGGWLFDALNINWGGLIGQIGTAAIGAAILLWVWNKLVK